ncbi:hypothetical protein [Nostoc commune]|nr:hypothetical protein [Nostoc commune]
METKIWYLNVSSINLSLPWTKVQVRPSRFCVSPTAPCPQQQLPYTNSL